MARSLIAGSLLAVCLLPLADSFATTSIVKATATRNTSGNITVAKTSPASLDRIHAAIVALNNDTGNDIFTTAEDTASTTTTTATTSTQISDNGKITSLLSIGAIAGVIGTVMMMTLQIVLYNVVVCLLRRRKSRKVHDVENSLASPKQYGMSSGGSSQRLS